MFKLTAREMEEEPLDQFLVNLFIRSALAKQKQRQEKWQTQT